MEYDVLTPIEKFTEGVRAAQIMRHAIGLGQRLRWGTTERRKARRVDAVTKLNNERTSARLRYACATHPLDKRLNLKHAVFCVVQFDRWCDPDPRAGRRRMLGRP